MKIFQTFCILFLIIFLFSNCTSVEKYNLKLSQPISVAKLQKDINYTQNKLEKLYPNLYGYISKEKLNYKFDSIRKVVSKPMTSKEFYFVISPVIATIRQGHMTMSPVSKRISKKEAKRLKKAGDGPLSQFGYEWQNEKLYIIKNKSKNKTINLGVEVVSVNEIKPQSLYEKYRNSITSDGFNTTHIRKSFSKRYVNYMTNEIGINDSLKFVLRQNDSIVTQVVSRNKPSKKTITKVKNAIKDSSKVLVKRSIDKDKLKKEKKLKKIYGYDLTNKEFVKSLRFFDSDSSVAVLRIKNFSDGKFVIAYKTIFDSIYKKNIKTLIIDVRDNPGGRVADVVKLYSYLTDKNYILLQPANVTSKTSMWKTGVFRNTPKLVYPLLAIGYPFYMGFSYFRTTKNADGTFQYKLVGSKTKKYATNNFKGKIYVLINGGSFSASCILASSLKSNPNVTFVGEETGGSFNGTVAGITPVVDLPNSKIPWRLGLMNIKTINQTEIFGRGVFPDVEIIQTVEEKIKNIDPEMNWILNDNKNKKR
ncbi:S41 family peptidase [Flavobacterium sp.]|uniref:S41 family peptidase n=1 Tax=Flavobacterium sp. TaxID=239 RepID=UPI0037504E9F